MNTPNDRLLANKRKFDEQRKQAAIQRKQDEKDAQQRRNVSMMHQIAKGK